jgi:P-type E1-E2 ATPase
MLQAANLEGRLVTFVAIKYSIVGMLLFSDSIRPNLKDTIKSLRAYKVSDILMLSGDKQIVVDKIAQKIGLDKSFGQLLPQDKVKIIKDMIRKDRKVAMVGDGINDAPALSFSRLGIAMGKHGSAVSSEVADVVLTDDNLSKITQFIGISKSTLRIAKQSIIFGMSLSVIAMFLASFGVIKPVSGALLQEAIDVTVILNALRVLTIRSPNNK